MPDSRSRGWVFEPHFWHGVVSLTCPDPGIFSRGGGGGGVPSPTVRKQSGQGFSFFVLNLFYSLQRGSNGIIAEKMKKVNKQCLLDTPRTVRFSEKTWQVMT